MDTPPLRLDDGLWLFQGQDRADARETLLRRHLVGILGCVPEQVRVVRDENGKPFLAEPHHRLHFSTSHRDGLLLVATSWDRVIGGDLELLSTDGQDDMPVARQLFAEGEGCWLASLTPSERSEAFYRLWTAKEAVLKARGTGIVEGLAEPDFSPFLTAGQPLPWVPVHISANNVLYAVKWFPGNLAAGRLMAATAVVEGSHASEKSTL